MNTFFVFNVLIDLFLNLPGLKSLTEKKKEVQK